MKSDNQIVSTSMEKKKKTQTNTTLSDSKFL